jgi:hypothetical protein
MLVNLKYYRMAQVGLYDKESGERMSFRKIIPLGAWHFPQSLANSSIDSRSYGFFFRIHNWLDADTVKVDLDIVARRKRPSFTAHLEYDVRRTHSIPMVVSLLVSEQRSLYAYKTLSPIRGDMVYGGKHSSFDPAHTTGFFRDAKGFYPYRTHLASATGFGFDGENRRYGFSLAEFAVREPFNNNENALWVDGALSPLPPIKITMPEGIDSEWVIQDMEGMVDLTFTPQEPMRSAFNLVLLRSEYHTPLGFFNGMIVDSKGEQIQVRNLWGLGEQLYMRV